MVCGVTCHVPTSSYVTSYPFLSLQHAYDVIYHKLWCHSMVWYDVIYDIIYQYFTFTPLFTMAPPSPHDVSSWFQRLSVCSHSFSSLQFCLSLPLILAVAMIFSSSTTIHPNLSCVEMCAWQPAQSIQDCIVPLDIWPILVWAPPPQKKSFEIQKNSLK